MHQTLLVFNKALSFHAACLMSTSQGADAPLSGLIAMLTALDILVNASVASSFRRPLVFAAMRGDAWGAMGTRRLLYSMHRGANATRGLHWDGVQAVVEIGAVGRSNTTPGVTATLFGHTAHRSPYAADSEAVLKALHAGAEATGGVAFGPAREAALPPGALAALLRVKAVPAVLVAEFESTLV